MPILDQVNRVRINFFDMVDNFSPETYLSKSVFVPHDDGGVVMCAYLRDIASGRFHTFTIQESSDDTNFTDVPDIKIVDLTGKKHIRLPLQQPTTPLVGKVGKLGVFSTEVFLRFKVVTTGVGGPSVTFMMFAIAGEEELPFIPIP